MSAAVSTLIIASISYREEKRIVDESTNEGITEGERISVDSLLLGNGYANPPTSMQA